MAIVMGMNGPCLKLDGEVLAIKGINGNPFVVRKEFDPVFHEMVEREIYLPCDMVQLLDLVIKRYSLK